MEKVFGRETVYVRCGGSIPIVGLFQEALGIPSVMMGFGLPDDNIHAPNEKMSLRITACGDRGGMSQIFWGVVIQRVVGITAFAVRAS